MWFILRLTHGELSRSSSYCEVGCFSGLGPTMEREALTLMGSLDKLGIASIITYIMSNIYKRGGSITRILGSLSCLGCYGVSMIVSHYNGHGILESQDLIVQLPYGMSWFL